MALPHFMWFASEEAGGVCRKPLPRLLLGMKELYSIPGCRVERVTRRGQAATVVVARPEARGARCPSCKTLSDTPHGAYVRRPDDLPSAGRSVQLHLRVRRFSCQNMRCTRRTFSERLPHLLAPHARRTRRLATAQRAVGMTTGAEAGAKRPIAKFARPQAVRLRSPRRRIGLAERRALRPAR